ncbi:MAG: hypothetical protein AAGA85_20165 [Bacteroidota bacterium]
MMHKIHLLVSAVCLSIITATTAQDLAKPQDHKPLLGEVHYGNRVGGIQAQEGPSVQLIAIDEGDALKSVQVYLGERDIVGGFELELLKEAGKLETFSFGDITGAPQEKYLLNTNKKIIGIRGASGWYIDNLQFVFDDGSMTPRYGAQGGDLDFSLVLNRNPEGQLKGRLMGFWGSHTHYLETIGLVFWPIE